MTVDVVCPNCGVQDEYSSPTCPDCGYSYRYDDLADFGIDGYRFIVTLKCLNCGNTIKRGFQRGDSVRYKPPSAFRSAVIDEVNGNVILGNIDDKDFQFCCPCCHIDHMLLIVDRTPIEPKPARTSKREQR